nr:glycoside hydrolase family 9 protein [Lachnospiraceae bacterium]
TTYNVDVSGGFHDAGDHVKFGLPQGYAASTLALSYYEFGEAFEATGQSGHLQTIMDYFCDYFQRCTVYNDDGEVVAFCYQVGEGGADHGYWGAPENQTGSRPVYFATSSNPATDEVSVAIAALALHYVNFGNEEYLKVAEDLFEFVKSNSKGCTYNGCAGFYDSSSWKDDYASAAAALYVATNDNSYKKIFNSNFTDPNTGWSYCWDNTWGFGAALMEDKDTLYSIGSYQSNNLNEDGLAYVQGWGCLRYNSSNQMMGLIHDKIAGNLNEDDGAFVEWATGQMGFILGNNSNGVNFVVGDSDISAKWPHHRAASRSSSAQEMKSDHYTLLGGLVGGVSNPSDVYGSTPGNTYYDDQGQYTYTEVALDYNATLVGAAAALFMAHANDDGQDNTLLQESELSEEYLLDIYYDNDGEVPVYEPTTTKAPTNSKTPSEDEEEEDEATEIPAASSTASPSKTETPSEDKATETPADDESDVTESPSSEDEESEDSKVTESPSKTETPSEDKVTEAPAGAETEAPVSAETQAPASDKTATPSSDNNGETEDSDTSEQGGSSSGHKFVVDDSTSAPDATTAPGGHIFVPGGTDTDSSAGSSTTTDTNSTSNTGTGSNSSTGINNGTATGTAATTNTTNTTNIASGNVINVATASGVSDSAVTLGKKFVYKGATYIIIKGGEGKSYEVKYFKNNKKKAKSAKVPAVAKYSGIDFKVTQINKNAFKNNKKLKKVTIFKNVTVIGANAFAGCKSLTTVVVKSSKIKKVAKNAFKKVNKNCTIKCAKKLLAKYKKLFKIK